MHQDFLQAIKKHPSSYRHDQTLINLELPMLKLSSFGVLKIVNNVNTLNSLKHLNAPNVHISLISQRIVSLVPMVTTLQQ